MGFCLFDNVAVAARHALDAHGLERVLVLDWDVHHGNGTNDDLPRARRACCSSRSTSGRCIPGTGPASDVGSGAGDGLHGQPAGAGGRRRRGRTRSLLEHVVAPLARAYEPQLVLVSAGFDAHRDDPLAGVELTEDGFAALAGSLRRLAAELEAPVGAVLEGGYDLRALAASTAATLRVLTAAEPPPRGRRAARAAGAAPRRRGSPSTGRRSRPLT